jgi:Bacterial Ig domain
MNHSAQRVLGGLVTLGSVVSLVIGCLVLLAATPAGASSTSYYVDNTAACPGSGTQASPWCNFQVVNSMAFQPGDRILLKRGDTFTTGIYLRGSGTSSSYVTVAAYGTGAAPVINGNDNTSFVGIHLNNNSYIQIEGMTIENSEAGILIDPVTNQTGFRFLYLTLSGDSEGIQSPSGTDTGIASNVLVQDVQGAQNTFSCSINSCEGSTLDLGAASNVIVNRLYTYNSCKSTGWNLGAGATNVIIENSESQVDGYCVAPVGTTANFLDNDTNVTFVNDIVINVPATGSADRSAIDIEPQDGPDTGVKIEDSYIANNAGPGIQVLDHPAPITNLTISGNVLSDNGAFPSVPFGYALDGQIWTDEWLANSVEASGSIVNNFYNAPTGTGGFEVSHGGANFNGFDQSNNIDVSGPSNVWYAANGFSCTTQGANGWSYQSSTDNATWTNLAGCATVNTLDQEWTTGGTTSGLVSNFEEMPPAAATSWVARSWRAANSGDVSVRGRLLMTDPTCASGVTAEITKNGSSTPLWGPQTIAAGDDVGVDTNLDGVGVNVGDVLHFAVQGSGSTQCRVSWTPSIGIANPVTTVLSPSGGATLTGAQTLQASATDSASSISSVQFVLTGGTTLSSPQRRRIPLVGRRAGHRRMCRTAPTHCRARSPTRRETSPLAQECRSPLTTPSPPRSWCLPAARGCQGPMWCSMPALPTVRVCPESSSICQVGRKGTRSSPRRP